jgi:hypothetical protein
MTASKKILIHSNTNFLDIGQHQPHTGGAHSDGLQLIAHICNPGVIEQRVCSGTIKSLAHLTLAHYHYQAKGF